uniref:60S ribosomal protein L23a-like n=1 Tax=Ictidomys tridecemlineatus TaxID=43179 RepID=UPI001A9EA342|nr:60S ribosomal protein L23a-like [Ictidomys tridecemlineatus]
MVPHAKKESPALLKAEAKAKALKDKKAVVKGSTATKRRQSHLIYFLVAQDIVALEATQISSKESSRRNKLDGYAIIKFPVTAELAMEKTFVFIVDIKANKHQIK